LYLGGGTLRSNGSLKYTKEFCKNNLHPVMLNDELWQAFQMMYKKYEDLEEKRAKRKFA
jgi:hypothetical protein